MLKAIVIMNVKCCVHVLHNVYHACCGVLLLEPEAQNFQRITKERHMKLVFYVYGYGLSQKKNDNKQNVHTRKTASSTSLHNEYCKSREKTSVCPVPAFVPLTWKINL